MEKNLKKKKEKWIKMDKNLKRVKLFEEKKKLRKENMKKIIDSRRMLKGKRI